MGGLGGASIGSAGGRKARCRPGSKAELRGEPASYVTSDRFDGILVWSTHVDAMNDAGLAQVALMVFKREVALKAVVDSLALVEKSCELRGLLHLFDAHVLSHHFFCRLLNELYTLKLEVMDRIQDNYPAIDLGDTENRTAFQVTTEKTSAKVQHTLEVFARQGLQAKFSKLRVLVIGKRQERYTALLVPQGVTFDPDEDIVDIRGLVKCIERLPTPALENVAAIFSEELSQFKKKRRNRLGLALGGSLAGGLLLASAVLPKVIAPAKPTPSGQTKGADAAPTLSSASKADLGTDSIDSPRTVAAELIVTDVHDAPPATGAVDSEIDATVKRVESRLFRISNAASSGSSSTGSPMIEIVDQFDGRLNNVNTKKAASGKAIDFVLSNRGDVVLFVDKIWLTVLDSDEYSLYSFPVGVRIPMKPIKYEVALGGSHSEYVITEEPFKYGKGECDYFSVQIKAKEGSWFRVKVGARWRTEGTSGQRVVTSREHLTGYPKKIDYKSLLANAKKLDIQINPGGLFDLRSLPALKDDSTRILVPGASFYQPTLFEDTNLSRAGDNVRPTGEGVRWCLPRCSGEDFERLTHQYIIIDDKAVLCNYQELYGLLLRDPSDVKVFRDHFEACWNYPFLFRTADEMINGLRDRKSPPERRVVAAYNLRHFPEPNGIAALVDNVCDSSDKVSQAAKASLEILGASEVLPIRSTVAGIVFEKCKRMTASANSAEIQWLKDYLSRVQRRR